MKFMVASPSAKLRTNAISATFRWRPRPPRGGFGNKRQLTASISTGESAADEAQVPEFYQASYRLIDPGSQWRLHREWFKHSAMGDLLGADFGQLAESPREW